MAWLPWGLGALYYRHSLPAHAALFHDVVITLGAIALFASMTNIVSGFLITDRMLKLFKTAERRPEASRT